MTSPLTPEMVALLKWLRQKARKGEKVRQADAAREFSVSVQAMNGRLGALELRGLVRREKAIVDVPTPCFVFYPVKEEGK